MRLELAHSLDDGEVIQGLAVRSRADYAGNGTHLDGSCCLLNPDTA
jgi:hypothetical protein